MNTRASELGRAIHERRKQLGMSLRELARRIDKQPSYIVALERNTRSPGATDETLEALAEHLSLDSDILFGLANRAPADSLPASALEVALLRAIKTMNTKEKQLLLKYIETRLSRNPE